MSEDKLTAETIKKVYVKPNLSYWASHTFSSEEDEDWYFNMIPDTNVEEEHRTSVITVTDKITGKKTLKKIGGLWIWNIVHPTNVYEHWNATDKRRHKYRTRTWIPQILHPKTGVWIDAEEKYCEIWKKIDPNRKRVKRLFMIFSDT